jgi:hypothetical protein
MIGRGGGRGGRGMQRKDAREEWPDLVDVVLAWSLKDVMNEGLFKDKVGASSHTDLSHQFFAQFAGWAAPRLCVRGGSGAQVFKDSLVSGDTMQVVAKH